MDRLEAMGLAPSTAQNVLTGRDLNLRGILNSRALTGVPTGVAPMGVNVPSDIQSIDVGYPANDLMAGLNRMQKMGLKSKKQAVDMGLMSPQEVLDSISPFNDPDDPATIEEVKEYFLEYGCSEMCVVDNKKVYLEGWFEESSSYYVRLK